MDRSNLRVLSEEPLNAETRLDVRPGSRTPAGRHYVRTHFAMPEAPARLVVEGARPVDFSVDDIRGLERRTLAVTLECAGNGRGYLEPAVPGEQWGLGAVGTAEWTGVPLRMLLERAGIPPRTVEVHFRGADEGVPKDLGQRIAYERSLPLADALHDDVLVSFAMDGSAIPREHGGLLRLIVPGWYGMASVKWLTRVELSSRPLDAFFQTQRYVIDGRPLREIAPRAVITAPANGESFGGSPLHVRGYAWSGMAPVARVDLARSDGRALAAASVSDGSWKIPAGRESRWAWREFSFELDLPPGEHAIVALATDAAGNTQPPSSRWNALGYANNAPRPVRFSIAGA